MHPMFVCMTDVVYILLIIYYYYQNYSTHIRLTSRIRYEMTVLRLQQRQYSLKSHTIGFTISKCCMTQQLYYYYAFVHRSESYIIFIIPKLIRYYYSSLAAREPNESVYIYVYCNSVMNIITLNHVLRSVFYLLLSLFLFLCILFRE